jgi:hypothetical protein
MGVVSFTRFKEKFACSLLFPEYGLQKFKSKVFTKHLSLRTTYADHSL